MFVKMASIVVLTTTTLKTLMQLPTQNPLLQKVQVVQVDLPASTIFKGLQPILGHRLQEHL